MVFIPGMTLGLAVLASARPASAATAGLARSRRSPPRVNASAFDELGYVTVDDVFSPAEIDAMRAEVLKLAPAEGMRTGPLFDPDIIIPDFMARPHFALLHALPTWAPLVDALRQVFRDEPFRFCSHNDISINRVVSWHKDRLNHKYRPYQKLPLWSAGTPVDGGHKIVKVAIYLQDHTNDDTSLLIVPRSYLNPVIDKTGARRLHPRKGSVVIFEQRSTHRGLGVGEGLYQGWFGQSDRVLISLGYGLSNAWTSEFEAGTRARQAEQCAAKCVGPHPAVPEFKSEPVGAGRGEGAGKAGATRLRWRPR